MITRTQRETVMLEALEWIARELIPCPLTGCGSDLCVAARAIAAVKAMDDAEMAARGTGSAGGEVAGE